MTTSLQLGAQTFVIISDMPYSDEEKKMLQKPDGELYKLISQTKPSVVMHLGDIKSGGLPCTDSLLIEHKEIIRALAPNRIIYTPGDNEWTDCDRTSLSHSFDELERLDYLIELMYQTPTPLDNDLTSMSSQIAQIENKLWINDRLAFSTLHIVGTSNGRSNIGMSNPQHAISAADQRDQLNFAWLKEIENKASEFDAVIIGFHADIYHKNVMSKGACNKEDPAPCDAFSAYRAAFKDLAKRINKPVLVSHGDTAEYCFEKLDTNLWHLNAAGDYQYSDATRVTFNKGNNQKPFSVNGLINSHLPMEGCKYK